MQQVQVTGQGRVGWVTVPEPEVGSGDILLATRACGICGSDAFYAQVGGIPPLQGRTPLGHEVAAEVIQVGSAVTGEVSVGDHVVVDVKLADGLLGGGGPQGGLSPRIVIRDFVPGRQVRVIPKHIPWEVAALNEPMAVAHHGVNRSGAKAGDQAVVFGAGPIGLGAVLSLRAKGVSHIVVVGRGGPRLERALEIGADAVVDATREDVKSRLIEVHGEAGDALGRGGRAGTDIYIDAVGDTSVIDTAVAAAKHRAVITILGVHSEPVPVEFGKSLTQELDFRVSMGYPDEIFEVTDAIIANTDAYARIISDLVPFEDALEALEIAKHRGATLKVVVTFDETETPGLTPGTNRKETA